MMLTVMKAFSSMSQKSGELKIMKKLILVVVMLLLGISIASAQTNQSPRKLQKLEAFASVGGLVFIDKSLSITSVKDVPSNEFFSYRQEQLKRNSFISLDKPGFDFSAKTPSRWENNNIIIEKDGNYSKITKIGIRQDFEIGFNSFDKDDVIVDVIANDMKFGNVRLKKDFITLIPIILDPINETRGFLAIQARAFGFQRTPCSLDEIVEDVINKSKPSLCS